MLIVSWNYARIVSSANDIVGTNNTTISSASSRLNTLFFITFLIILFSRNCRKVYFLTAALFAAI